VLLQKTDEVLVESESHPAVLVQVLVGFPDCRKLKVKFGGCPDVEEPNLLTSLMAVSGCSDQRVPLACNYVQKIKRITLTSKFCLDDDEREISETESRKNQVRIEEAPHPQKVGAFRHLPVLHHQQIHVSCW